MKIRSAKNAEIICARIAQGLTLREIAKELDCAASTISLWCAEDAQFAEQYARAKAVQMDRFAEEIVEIADDGTNDWMERRQGEETIRVVDHEHIQRSRVRIDARKWLMAKMAPKKYGDSLALTGANHGPIQVQHKSDAERAAEAVAVIDETFGLVMGVSKGTETVQ